MSDIAQSATPIELRIASEKTGRLDRYTDFLSDWCSPILIKETRQALKSRQFFWTFFLLLVAVAGWTMLGLTINDTSVEFGQAGMSLLTGYWVILGFPLAIVIPFGAYRSLAREFEDGTIQLISVTTMNAWQIVAGKLGSSLLQMLVYLSILAPCIAFTYLLKGISLPQISIGLAICIVGSFTLCCIALFLAGATQSKFFSVGVSILLIALQFFAYWMWCMAAYGIAYGELNEVTRDEGLIVTLALLTAVGSTGMLAFAAATGMISFAADNRSTFTRVMMLLQQTLFIAFCIGLMCFVIFPEQAVILSLVTAHYWLLMGFSMIGEPGEVSRRVKRSIPSSFFARSAFSLLLPGSGRGLLFATINIWICGAVFFIATAGGPFWFPEPVSSNSFAMVDRQVMTGNELSELLLGTFAACLYPSFFLALTWLICNAIRRRWSSVVSSLLSFLIGILTVTAVTGFPLLYHYNFLHSSQWRDHSWDQMFNWYWTTIELTESRFLEIDFLLWSFAVVVMGGTCLLVWVFAARELLQRREETPDRVQEEIREVRKFEQLPPGESIDEIFAADTDHDG